MSTYVNICQPCRRAITINYKSAPKVDARFHGFDAFFQAFPAQTGEDLAIQIIAQCQANLRSLLEHKSPHGKL